MKLQLLSKSLFAALLMFFAAAHFTAQTEPAPTAKPAKVTPAERHQKHSDEVAKELNLTPEQKAQFQKIDEEYKAKSKATRAAKKEEAAKIREERIKAHKAVLTPEQAAKYDEIQAKKKAKHEGKKAKKAKHKSEKKSNKAEKKAIKKELEKQ